MQNTQSLTSGLIIGFSGTYYCLWNWQNETNYSMTANYQYVASGGYTKYYYIKRISTDIEKVKQLYPELPIDMGLHGTKWAERQEYKKREVLPHDAFPYGFRCEGEKIMECSEAKYVWALYLSNEIGIGRSKVYARKRLVELGLLVAYKTAKKIAIREWNNETESAVETGEVITIRSSYCSPKFAERLEADKLLVRGHFLQEGKRVKMMLKKVKSFSFETKFGTCYVVEYINAENQVFKYKGSTPPRISKEEFETVEAGIKWSEYRGQNETLIQRVKVFKAEPAFQD